MSLCLLARRGASVRFAARGRGLSTSSPCGGSATQPGGPRAFQLSSTGPVTAADLFDPHDTFLHRHIGPSEADTKHMLHVVGVQSVDELMRKTVPASIRSYAPLATGPEAPAKVAPPRGERELLQELRSIMSRNQVFRSHLGMGYYDVITPQVILRNILENPRWYTPYTPYSAEVAQGRLEMLLNFQTMVSDLTGLPCANASLLDEATAVAEAVNLCASSAPKGRKSRAIVVSDRVHPQTLAVVQTRAAAVGLEVRVVSDVSSYEFKGGDEVGVVVQYPDTAGRLDDFESLATRAHDADALVVAATDLLALTVLTPPGEWGADVAVGSAQRFGVPMGYGGPHAAFFATGEEYRRQMPGRVIGVSVDSAGRRAYRMALQTREQHIRREKATSNICTAQALLANIAAAYSIYHGPDGLRRIAGRAHAFARVFAAGASKLGVRVGSQRFFDTVHLTGLESAARVRDAAEARRINVRVMDAHNVTVSFDETTTEQHVNELLEVVALSAAPARNAGAAPRASDLASELHDLDVPQAFRRSAPFMEHPVFHRYRTETEMLRYLNWLNARDLCLADAMIPLGSCTMKLNATSEMVPVTWPEVGGLHPAAPVSQAAGYAKMIRSLARDLAAVTGFSAVSLQPNSGAQGEYAGLLTIQAYHRSRGEGHRNVCLIPTSAHGTNPASAVMAGLKVVVVKCDAQGNVDLDDLRAVVQKNASQLSCLMMTYPSTHGVFEEGVRDVIAAVHAAGGQVYMDGANMNAQVGLCSPGAIGADVCHLNLHKTFCIPHGGGGPGMGPIAVATHLAPFLPGHVMVADAGGSTGPVSAAPYGSASILPISWMYINLMGSTGLRQATEMAILNANYMAKRLEPHYKILYRGTNGTVAHEFILDFRGIKKATGISEEDVAKRLMDYNFHAPTMSFPVVGTLMIEPTESESLYELDRFCDAMIQIRAEIREVEEGKVPASQSVLARAPHPAEDVTGDKWDRPYSREQAAYPLPYLRTKKFWPTISRINNVAGDLNVVCTCPPVADYSAASK